MTNRFSCSGVFLVAGAHGRSVCMCFCSMSWRLAPKHFKTPCMTIRVSLLQITGLYIAKNNLGQPGAVGRLRKRWDAAAQGGTCLQAACATAWQPSHSAPAPSCSLPQALLGSKPKLEALVRSLQRRACCTGWTFGTHSGPVTGCRPFTAAPAATRLTIFASCTQTYTRRSPQPPSAPSSSPWTALPEVPSDQPWPVSGPSLPSAYYC